MSKNAFFKLFILTLSIGAFACSKSDPPAGPSDAVLATFKALEAQDTAAFLATLTQDKVDAYTMNPSRLDTIMRNWKGQHADVKILSTQQNDSTATVLYNITVTGPRPHARDSILTRLYMEGGQWKHGY